jgi:predicted dehydrogenase
MSMSEPLRVGVVGAGRIGRMHAEIVARNTDVDSAACPSSAHADPSTAA